MRQCLRLDGDDSASLTDIFTALADQGITVAHLAGPMAGTPDLVFRSAAGNLLGIRGAGGNPGRVYIALAWEGEQTLTTLPPGWRVSNPAESVSVLGVV